MKKENRQAGETVKNYALVAVAALESENAAILDEFRKAANRHYVSKHAEEIATKAGEICGSLWHDGKQSAIPEETKLEIIDAAKSALVRSIIRNYDPLNPKNHASAMTYGSKAAYCDALKATAKFFDGKRRGKSLDDEIKGGKEGSKTKTYAETLSEDVIGRLPLRTKVDLLLLRPHLTDTEWEVFYEMRYCRYMEHVDIARHFDWTESRYRWFWKRLKDKLLVLCDLRRSKIR